MSKSGNGAPSVQYVASFLIDAAASNNSASHVAMVIREFVRQGLSASEALRAIEVARTSARQHEIVLTDYETEVRSLLDRGLPSTD